MPDVGTLPTEFVVYVVPGYVVLLAVTYAWAPDFLAAAKEKLGAGQVIGSAVTALLLGIFIHQLSTFFLNVIGWPSFTGIVENFAHSAAARVKIERSLGFPVSDAADAYFYGRILVGERAPHAAESATRLLQLANVCQNMIVAVLIAAWPIGHGLERRGWKRSLRFSVAFGVAVALVVVFFYGLRLYWTAAIWRILRAVLLFS
jgi:hypothetical protein